MKLQNQKLWARRWILKGSEWDRRRKGRQKGFVLLGATGYGVWGNEANNLRWLGQHAQFSVISMIIVFYIGVTSGASNHLNWLPCKLHQNIQPPCTVLPYLTLPYRTPTTQRRKHPAHVAFAVDRQQQLLGWLAPQKAMGNVEDDQSQQTLSNREYKRYLTLGNVTSTSWCLVSKVNIMAMSTCMVFFCSRMKHLSSAHIRLPLEISYCTTYLRDMSSCTVLS